MQKCSRSLLPLTKGASGAISSFRAGWGYLVFITASSERKKGQSEDGPPIGDILLRRNSTMNQ